MRLQDALVFVMGATLDDLASAVANGEIGGEEISQHGLAVASIVAAQNGGAWGEGFEEVVGNVERHGREALALARVIGGVYGARRGSAAETHAAAELVWRLTAERCGALDGGDHLALRTSAAYWIFGPAGLAMDDGGGEVWTATWAEALTRLEYADDVSAAWNE